MSFVRSLSLEVLQAFPLPDAPGETDKNSRGRVLAVVGSRGAPGAALLSGVAALRAGAGKVQLAIPRTIGTGVGVAFPEAGILGLRETRCGEPQPEPRTSFETAVRDADAILVGPGIMDRLAAKNLATTVLHARVDGAIALDALALCEVRKFADLVRECRGRVVLTPHHGEMAALLGIEKSEITSEPLKYAVEVARELDAIVILKSSTTYIVQPSGEAWEHVGGVVGLGTAGSGDVLGGILTGLLARGADPLAASLWAVVTHAQAGRTLTQKQGEIGFLARELLPLIPKFLNRPLDANGL